MCAETVFLVVRLVITALTIVAAVIPIVAAFSVLRGWRDHRKDVAKWESDDAILREALSTNVSEDFTEAVTRTGRYQPTWTDLNVNLTIGGRPRPSFQPVEEVWWGVAALASATAAGLLGTWFL